MEFIFFHIFQSVYVTCLCKYFNTRNKLTIKSRWEQEYDASWLPSLFWTKKQNNQDHFLLGVLKQFLKQFTNHSHMKIVLE